MATKPTATKPAPEEPTQEQGPQFSPESLLAAASVLEERVVYGADFSIGIGREVKELAEYLKGLAQQ